MTLAAERLHRLLLLLLAVFCSLVGCWCC